ncbi:four helix bundle protein [Rhodocaloribacter litoris]|uniref:four helix bundle protein n=1 Tax=Rhodocaloribacter litoris TaxID=2558931 RepID=UPI001422FD5E|nr:four helix bundle protein [Rhodocaloribacter litoris]QXD16252.1 four helix bundle protein [Rhodocaloribacter litoris]
MDETSQAYGAWVASVPETLLHDPLWRMKVYRIALFLVDVGWGDVSALMQDRRMYRVAEQLYGALGSIGANIAEGYSRASGRDRARYYEYALGSARECRSWYYQARHVLGDEVITHRMKCLEQVIRMLLRMIPSERAGKAFEPEVIYGQDSSLEQTSEGWPPPMEALLRSVPVVSM